jgi:hypothetical protein
LAFVEALVEIRQNIHFDLALETVAGDDLADFKEFAHEGRYDVRVRV